MEGNQIPREKECRAPLGALGGVAIEGICGLLLLLQAPGHAVHGYSKMVVKYVGGHVECVPGQVQVQRVNREV